VHVGPPNKYMVLVAALSWQSHGVVCRSGSLRWSCFSMPWLDTSASSVHLDIPHEAKLPQRVICSPWLGSLHAAGDLTCHDDLTLSSLSKLITVWLQHVGDTCSLFLIRYAGLCAGC
jgi:hypothetical protein